MTNDCHPNRACSQDTRRCWNKLRGEYIARRILLLLKKQRKEWWREGRDSEARGSLACCGAWGCRESDTTQRWNSNKMPGTGMGDGELPGDAEQNWGGVLLLPSGDLPRPTRFVFSPLGYAALWDSKTPLRPAGEMFPGVWKLLLHDSLSGMGLHH